MKKAKKQSLAILMVIAVFILTIGGIFFLPFFDWNRPKIVLTSDINIIGRKQAFDADFAAPKSGLKHIQVVISQNGKRQTITDISYDKRKTHTQNVALVIEPSLLGLTDGPATLEITAKSFSWLRSESTLTKNVSLDLIPPQIFFLTTTNNVNSGGVCVSLFRTSKPVVEAGIFVNETFFRAYPVTIGGKPCYLTYFAIPIDAGERTPAIRAFIKDAGNNEAWGKLHFTLASKQFRHDKVNISDRFLQQTMPEFQMAFPELRGKTLIDTFRHINTVMRDDNLKTIQEICKQSQPKILWQGQFLRLQNSASMALYGDRRTWVYNGQTVGESLHEGIDLASTAQAPVQAANSGLVAFTGSIGIYGETVIIDHGMGMISLYAHLSSIQVSRGQSVGKGDIIGNTGVSGLAAGDHLHFSIMVGGQFVNPIEWWDPNWIKNNVIQKINVSF